MWLKINWQWWMQHTTVGELYKRCNYLSPNPTTSLWWGTDSSFKKKKKHTFYSQLEKVGQRDNHISKHFLGVFAADQIPLGKIGCCIVNTDPMSKSGQHWVCVFTGGDGKRIFISILMVCLPPIGTRIGLLSWVTSVVMAIFNKKRVTFAEIIACMFSNNCVLCPRPTYKEW